MQGPYKVITLCGSTRFKDQFIEAQKRLTLEGNIVISVGLFGHSGDNEVWSEGTKEMLDDMHKRKIDMADEIFVINVGGYIGSSTKSEIEYAKRIGKTAPHKAVMLISIIDTITSGLYSANAFYFSDVLERGFRLAWIRCVGDNPLFKPVAATPFWHLGGEPFWHLKREDGGKIDEVQQTPSGAKLREMSVVASLDPELFTLLQDEQAADLLRGILIDTYLSSLQTHTTGI